MSNVYQVACKVLSQLRMRNVYQVACKVLSHLRMRNVYQVASQLPMRTVYLEGVKE